MRWFGQQHNGVGDQGPQRGDKCNARITLPYRRPKAEREQSPCFSRSPKQGVQKLHNSQYCWPCHGQCTLLHLRHTS